MPCCIAIVEHGQCSHSIIIKLGCTSQGQCCGGDDLCKPTSELRILLKASYRWSCEDCLAARFKAEDEDVGAVRRRVNEIKERDGLDPAVRESMIGWTVLRNEYNVDVRSRRRIPQLEEVQGAVAWAEQYGKAAFRLLYPSGPDAEYSSNAPEQLTVLLSVLLGRKAWDLTVRHDATTTATMDVPLKEVAAVAAAAVGVVM
ncbi:hypothetical protein E4U41_000170 [Claviceps citrina]|nr:hypothetical protein E4U41_000170 [Claviceps citrina]